MLRVRLPKVRRGGIEAFVSGRLPASVIGVTEGAMVGEVIAPLRNRERRGIEWVLQLLHGGRRRKASYHPRDQRLQCRGLRPRAKSVRPEILVSDKRVEDDCRQEDEKATCSP